MKQVTQNLKSGDLAVQEVPVPLLKLGGILVRNRYSLISAGTEKIKRELTQAGYLGKAKARPDQFKRVVDALKKEGPLNTYRKVMNKLDTLGILGYSSAGEVIEVAEDIPEFKKGDRVACAGEGYACHAEVVFVPKNLAVKLPENASFKQAAFTTLGAIALHGIRQANAQIGDNVLVMGLGLIGQITAQLLKASGCNVIGVDLDPTKVKLIKDDIELALVRSEEDIEERILQFTGCGADKAIITAATKSNDPVEFAGRIVRDKGIVVIVGDVRTDIPRKDYYQKELDIRFSRSYGPGRYDPQYEEKGVDYPIGYVRWTEQRNMEAFVKLLSERRLNLDKLITRVFPLEEAEQAYDLICGKTNEKFLGVLLEYPETGQEELTTRIRLKAVPTIRGKRISTTQIRIGFIGAGSYAQSYLLPHLKKQKDVQLVGVATATGHNAKNIAKKYGFAFCTTDATEIIESDGINTVFIATRHNLHAELAIRSLSQGKNVYIEKPLALNSEELDSIIEAVAKTDGTLMIGFNRRFSPFTQKVKKLFAQRQGPLHIIYRVNAGPLLPGHWLHDPEEGGGRIIGEICHFIDLINYFVESPPMEVFAQSISSGSSNALDEDTVNITLKYADGSLGTISYIAIGNKSLPKERIEIYGDNKAAVIEDFRRVVSYSKKGKYRERKWLGQDKGQAEMIRLYMKSLQEGKELIPFQESVMATDLTFRIKESLKKGTSLKLEH